MLDALRTAAGTWVAKLLLSLLVISFAIWGISGRMIGGFGASHVIVAGDTTVSLKDYRLAYDRQIQMMSQQLGTVIADRGGIGIADSLLKGHYMEGETKVAMTGVSGGPEKDRLDQERGLSTALVQEMQRRLTSDIAGETTPSMSDR